ncbi:DUF262 domain-containing protein [Paenibacillus taichungensis]|jgi:uncharacterized protein with ParB-like and HNH nuclease domain
MKFKDIPKFTSVNGYQINVFLHQLKRNIDEYLESGLEMNPDFQRGHVWTEEQQIRYVEYFLRGGTSARIIYFNSPNILMGLLPFVLVDGLQRLTALLRFLANEIKAFGFYYREFEGRTDLNLIFVVNDLQTREEVLQWYIEMNSGGTVHSDEEIERVKMLLEEERRKAG